MDPKKRLPLSKSDKLAEVDAELESAMDRLAETNERIDGVLSGIEDEAEVDKAEAGEVVQDDLDEVPGAESGDGVAKR